MYEDFQLELFNLLYLNSIIMHNALLFSFYICWTVLSLNREGGYYRYREKTIYGVIGLFVYSLEMLYVYIKYKKRFGYKYILKLGEIFYV